jgi:cytochrome c oxidase assembly protein Cox11
VPHITLSYTFYEIDLPEDDTCNAAVEPVKANPTDITKTEGTL